MCCKYLPIPMNRPTARPLARRAAIVRSWAATVGCLLLMILVSPADELYDFVATDLRGTPSMVTFRTARRNVTRSRRKVSRRREQRQTRQVSLRRERISYVRTRKRLRLPDTSGSSRTRLATARTTTARTTNRTSRTRVAASAGPRSNSGRRTTRTARQTRPRSNGSRRPAVARATPRASGRGPASSASRQGQNQNTLPGTTPDTIPDAPPVRSDTPVLAQAPERRPERVAQRMPEPAPSEEPEEPEEDGEEVRQNLSLAFVTPRRAPAVGVRLVARVIPAEGEEEILSNLTTDASGRVKLQNIALPAAIDLDFPGSKPTASGEPVEWDFADADKATLLLENPVGQGRSVLASDRARLVPVRAASAGGSRGAASRRVRLFEGEMSPIVLERQVVDLAIAAPAGSRLSSPALEEASPDSSVSQSVEVVEAITVPASGRLALRLPIEALEEGPIPIRVARELAGGEAEAVIESYATDAYTTNAVQSPPLRLVRLSQLDMAGRVGVMGTRANVARRLGDLKGIANKMNALGSVSPLADGSEWWTYPDTGIAFKMRLAPEARPADKSPAMRVERVRLFSANAGSFGTVKVGSTVAQLRAALGAPQAQNDKRTPADALSAAGQIDIWLDGGLRVCHDQARVLWLEAARPNVLLTGGTTAFVRRDKARLFIESFQSHAGIKLSNANDLRKYLEQEHAVQTVGSPEEADLILKARVSEFKASADAATNSYTSVTRLQYSLFDIDLGHFVAEGKQAEGTARVDLAEQGAPALAPQARQEERERATRQAAGAAGAISAAEAFNVLVSEVNRASDFSVRVTDIDYATGTLRLNVGRAQGLRVSKTDPDDFQITVAGTALPEQRTERSSQFYIARAIAVGQDWAVCRLLRVSHTTRTRSERAAGGMGGVAGSISEGISEVPAPEMVRRLPDPATGQIAARSWTPPPSEAPAIGPGIQQPTRTAPQNAPRAALPNRAYGLR